MAKMVIRRSGNTFQVESGYALRAYPKQAGLRWNQIAMVWETTSPQQIHTMITAAREAHVTVVMDDDVAQAITSLNQPQAYLHNLDLTPPAGMTYLPFQVEGIRFAAARRATLIADEMGLGKTVQALGLIRARRLTNVLIVAPKSLLYNWEDEAKRWIPERSVAIATTHAFPTTDIVIINYDIVQPMRAAIDARTWDLVVCDEAHYLKNPKAARTKAVVGGKGTQRIQTAGWLFLTGTPVLNRPIELWPLLPILDPFGLGKDWKEFVTNYCNGRRTPWGWDVSGASNIKNLEQRLHKVMVRRLKAQVLDQLPPKRRTMVLLDPNGASDVIQAEVATLETARQRIAQAMADAEAVRANEQAYREAIQKLNAVRISVLSEITKARKATGLAKVKAVVGFICDQQIDKVVVFAWHRDVVEAIAAAFGDAAVIVHGDTSVEARNAAVTRFQTDETCRVFVGTIAAAGIGLTLTAASTVVVTEMPWTPSLMVQAEDRCHRYGQSDAVSVYLLVYDKTVDAYIAQVLTRKENLIKQVLGDNEMLDLVLSKQ